MDPQHLTDPQGLSMDHQGLYKDPGCVTRAPSLVPAGAQAHVGSHVHQEAHDNEWQFARRDQLHTSSIDSEEDEVQTSSTPFQLSEKAQLLLDYPVHTLVADIKANVPGSSEIASEPNTTPVPFGVSIFGQTQGHESTNLPLSPLLVDNLRLQNISLSGNSGVRKASKKPFP